MNARMSMRKALLLEERPLWSPATRERLKSLADFERKGRPMTSLTVDGSQMETVQLALDEGSDIEAKDNERRTPLMRGVVLESSFLILQKLLERGAYMNAVDRHGQTCLMQAILTGREDVVKLLVDAGADLSHYNMYHNTALDMARSRDLKVPRLFICPELRFFITPKSYLTHF
ncbi:hypothetical protein C0J52_23633 [Blattella germanica]|nr:hypothetical protein C0J52_23633 [Blattella germanica]